MRVDLKVPFAEKDEAKGLGARWDPGKKLWYVADRADLSPFQRWLPSTGGAPVAPARRGHPAAVVTGPPQVTHCGCAVLPWESCVHSPPR